MMCCFRVCCVCFRAVFVAFFFWGGGRGRAYQERQLDPKIVAEVCSLNLKGLTPEKVAMAVQRRNKRADVRVAYELLIDSKKAKLRKEGM